jgi:hypothetical protein
MTMNAQPEVSMRTIRRAAANAECDTRTALKVALGRPVRGIVRERVADALRALGVDVPTPTEGPASITPGAGGNT